MPFNSETASLAGKKSKRPKQINTDDLRYKLQEFSEDLIDDLQKSDLSEQQKLQLVSTILKYVLPQLKSVEVNENDVNRYNQPLKIILNGN
jgi:hypothetical protein